MQVIDVQCDEIWGFVGMKEKTRVMKHPELVDAGDAYTFTAVEQESKLVLAWHLGTRTPEDTAYFADKLAIATAGEFQISTDGFLPYKTVIPGDLPQAHFAQVVKTFATKETGRMPAIRPAS